MQPHHRAGLADRQVDELRRHPVAERSRRRSSVRTLTGTIARTIDVGVTDSPRVSSHTRSAPATVASTTSLTVPPCALRTRL